MTRHLHQQLLHGSLRCKETNDHVVKGDAIKVISKQKVHSSGMGWPFLSSVLQIGMVWLVSQPIHTDTNKKSSNSNDSELHHSWIISLQQKVMWSNTSVSRVLRKVVVEFFNYSKMGRSFLWLYRLWTYVESTHTVFNLISLQYAGKIIGQWKNIKESVLISVQ